MSCLFIGALESIKRLEGVSVTHASEEGICRFLARFPPAMKELIVVLESLTVSAPANWQLAHTRKQSVCNVIKTACKLP
jgi:hypothetical protein